MAHLTKSDRTVDRKRVERDLNLVSVPLLFLALFTLTNGHCQITNANLLDMHV